MTITNNSKKQALLDLLEFSLIFNQKQRGIIVNNIDRFNEEEIDGLGKVLAAEHNNREKLDKEFIQTFIKTVEAHL